MSQQDATVLVVGAAGQFASLVVPALAGRGVRVRGLVRKPEQGEMVRRNGTAEIAVGDLTDRGSIDAALQGVAGAFFICPAFHPDEVRLGSDFVQACKDAGVHRFVYSAVQHPTATATPNQAPKGPIEAAVVESGMEFTILQLASFYQNWAFAWPSILEHGVVAEPFPVSARLAKVDYRDVAEVAAIAFTEDRLVNGTFELCADGYPNRADVAAVISEVLGRPIRAAESDFGAWAEQAGLPRETWQAAAAMWAYYGRFGSPGNAFTLRAILGREPRGLRQFFDDLRAGVPTLAV